MYCPQCSQEQVTEEMRFCSRCGFPLAIVSQLVAGGGVLAGFDSEGKRQLSPRQKGIRWGALLMIISGVLIPIVALMTAMKSDFFVLFLPVLMVFLIGLARLLHAYLLAQKTPTKNSSLSAAKTNLLPDAHRSALPAGQSFPATNWKQPVNTSEMAQPLSVTENTTKLLTNETDGN
jgi:hypothetical protein